MSSKKAASEGKRFFLGVILLFCATLVAKCIGLFYKIPLIRIVGVEGMAYFLAAYHIYSMLFVLAATGLPSALSLLVARADAEGRGGGVARIFLVSAALFLVLGGMGTGVLVLFAEPIARGLAMREAASAIVAIAPSLLLAGWIGAVRGYFQGRHRMLPTAVSEVLEAVGKLSFGLAFSFAAAKSGADAPRLAAAAILGITAGMLLSALYLACELLVDRLRHHRRRAAERRTEAALSRTPILSSLLRLALPMTLSASVMSLVSLVDTVLISGRLQASGLSPSVANSMYSAFGNLAVPLYNLVPTLLSPLTSALMPLMGASLARGEHTAAGQQLCASVRLTALISVPAALGLAVFAHPILQLLYGSSADAVSLAAPLLSYLALSVVPACFVTLTGGALQASGHTAVPVVAMGAGALVKLVMEFLLLTVPGIGITAAPLSTLACNLTVLAIQGTLLVRCLPMSAFSIGALFRPLLAGVCSIGVGMGVYVLLLERLAGSLPLVVTLVAVVPLFGVLALRIGAVTGADIALLPAGDRLCPLLERLRLLPRK